MAKKVKKVKKGNRNSRIVWTPDIWEKVAQAFAAIEIRDQQGGKSRSFRDMIVEAQAFLPASSHRSHLCGYAQTNHGFEKLVKKARELILQKMQNKGKINGATMEVLATPSDKIAYEVPASISLNKSLRLALKKAGFEFITIDGVNGLHDILKTRVERIERLAIA